MHKGELELGHGVGPGRGRPCLGPAAGGGCGERRGTMGAGLRWGVLLAVPFATGRVHSGGLRTKPVSKTFKDLATVMQATDPGWWGDTPRLPCRLAVVGGHIPAALGKPGPAGVLPTGKQRTLAACRTLSCESVGRSTRAIPRSAPVMSSVRREWERVGVRSCTGSYASDVCQVLQESGRRALGNSHVLSSRATQYSKRAWTQKP